MKALDAPGDHVIPKSHEMSSIPISSAGSIFSIAGANFQSFAKSANPPASIPQRIRQELFHVLAGPGKKPGFGNGRQNGH
jgi:hypothetical protein